MDIFIELVNIFLMLLIYEFIRGKIFKAKFKKAIKKSFDDRLKEKQSERQKNV